MASKEKIEQVKKLAEKLSKSKSLVLTEYHGLTVTKIEQLRNELQKNEADFAITKNTLLARAVKLANYENLPDEALQGPTATLFSYGDEVGPIKNLTDFIKANELPKIKIGYLGKTLISKEKVIELAKLPSYQELVGKVVGTLNAPIYGVVSVLHGNLRGLVYALSAIFKQRGGVN